MSDRIVLDGSTLNAPDALALATFYAALLGGTVHGDEHWAAARTDTDLIAFQQVDDFTAPTWPGGPAPMRTHLDFFVDDLDAAGLRARAAGARLLGSQPNADHCQVYADPVGHPFCLSTWRGRQLIGEEPTETEVAGSDPT